MKSCVWKLLLVAGVISLVLVGTVLGQAPFNAPNRAWLWSEGNPGLVAELQLNSTLHDLYVYVEWAYSDGTTIKDIWYFEQTLNAGQSIPLYAPRRHLNPWASLVMWAPVRSWGAYDYSPGPGRCTYNKLQVRRCRWDSSDKAVYGTVNNTGNLPTGYVALAALYDNNGNIIAANWAEKEGVDADDSDTFTVDFALLDLPGSVANCNCWAFQGQWGWQYVGSIFPNEPVPRTWPGLKNACPSGSE